MRRSILALVLTALAAGPAKSENQPTPWMSEGELRVTFGGATIDGHYPSGRGFTETYLSSGRLDYRDTRHATGGRWSITDGAFCTIYDDDPTGGCFRVMKSGSNCFEFYFISRTEEEARTPGQPDWTARGWLSTSASTCTEGSTV